MLLTDQYLNLLQEIRQLGDISRNAPRLVAGDCESPALSGFYGL
jgi:hypothetical protein